MDWCQIKGCKELGSFYGNYEDFMRNRTENMVCLCDRHAFDEGWCVGCGRQMGGIETFEWSDNGLCEDCQLDNKYD